MGKYFRLSLLAFLLNMPVVLVFLVGRPATFATFQLLNEHEVTLLSNLIRLDLAAISNFTKCICREVLLGAYRLFATSAEQTSDVPPEQAHE